MNRHARKIGILASFLMSAVSHAAILKSIVIKNNPGKTSIVCTFNQVPSHREFILVSPFRAVVDFNEVSSNIQYHQISTGSGLVSGVRGASTSPHLLRLVFDLKEAANMKIMEWRTGMNGAQGIRIELISKKSAEKSVAFRAEEKPQSLPIPHLDHSRAPSSFSHHVPRLSRVSTKPLTVKPAQYKRLRDVIIVIDAGHGGKDPGATGPRRNVEKNVVLSIAHKLRQRINSQPGMRAVMTRRGDYYIGLRERLNLARKYNADMFVSIHADAFNNKNSSGASVYALSPRGATSEAARWLAEKENYSELGGVDLSGLDDKNGLIRTVLLDLSQTATIQAGLQIGDSVLRHLDKVTTLHHNKVEQARFVVLKSPDIPSILVETGFITNPREEFNLTSPAYQTRLSQAIFEGVKRFFWETPPHGSRIEAMVDGQFALAKNTSRR